MKTIFIIIHYNDLESIQHLLENIKVVDNCSTSSCYKELKKLATKKIHVIQTKENKGFSAGMNFALKKIEKEVQNANIFFSNADIMIEKEEDLITLLQGLKQYQVVGPTIFQKDHIHKAWKLPTPKQEILMNIPYFYQYFEKKYRYYPTNYYQGNFPKVDVLSGCFFLTTLKNIKQLNYFDENVFLYYEENILAKKLQKQNYQAAICNSVTIQHNHAVTINKNIKYLEKYKILKQSQTYFEKNYNQASKLELFLLKMTQFISYKFYSWIYKRRK